MTTIRDLFEYAREMREHVNRETKVGPTYPDAFSQAHSARCAASFKQRAEAAELVLMDLTAKDDQDRRLQVIIAGNRLEEIVDQIGTDTFALALTVVGVLGEAADHAYPAGKAAA